MPATDDKEHPQLTGVGYEDEAGLPVLNVMPPVTPGAAVHLWIESEDGEASIELMPKDKAKLIKLLEATG